MLAPPVRSQARPASASTERPGWAGRKSNPPTLVVVAVTAAPKAPAPEAVGVGVGEDGGRALVAGGVLVGHHHLAGRADGDVTEVAGVGDVLLRVPGPERERSGDAAAADGDAARVVPPRDPDRVLAGDHGRLVEGAGGAGVDRSDVGEVGPQVVGDVELDRAGVPLEVTDEQVAVVVPREGGVTAGDRPAVAAGTGAGGEHGAGPGLAAVGREREGQAGVADDAVGHHRDLLGVVAG